jgi:hypothetical protein
LITFQKVSILKSFRQVHFSDFSQLCEFKTDSESHEDSFLLFSNFFGDQFEVETNKFHQINFKKNQIILASYSIKSGTKKYDLENDCFPLSWKLETCNQLDDWVIIDEQTKVEEMKEPGKVMMFNLAQQCFCSNLRITFLDSTGKRFVYISEIEFFGSIVDNQKILQNLIQQQKELQIVSPMTFEYNEYNNLGMMNFFNHSSLQNLSEIFWISSFQSKENSLSSNLMNWNDHNWESKSWPAYFFIHFRFPWIFRLYGYRIRSGHKLFPIEWRLFGSDSEDGKGGYGGCVLDEQKNNSDLLKKHSERSFRIQRKKFWNGFLFEFRENSEGGFKICLNSIEIFGILREMSEEEKYVRNKYFLKDNEFMTKEDFLN